MSASTSSMLTAVEVKNAYKYYGSKSKPTIILNKLNITVQAGTIYGLLGASGCGKTTLLSCIVGLRQLNGGEVQVLQHKPQTPGIGARIGYMPQEIALVNEMSVKESIYYFGRIYGMSMEQLDDKFQLLKKLLDLPPSSQQIMNCSGGQQRRISFACALVHDPELLILDEPTVGLDPMLRERIWEYLFTITRQSNTAVIITTHYIEEARQANCVGLMRNGILLIQDTPTNIMLRMEVDSLEEAFLMLSEKQGDTYTTTITQSTTNHIPHIIDSPQSTNHDEAIARKECKLNVQHWAILKALLYKNYIKMARNPAIIFFILLLPLLLLGIFSSYVGKTIKGNRLGIVNFESSCEGVNRTQVISANDTCYLRDISCHFIKTLQSTDFIKPILYDNVDDAFRDAKKASIIGYINIPSNFSKALQTRFENGIDSDDGAVEQSIMETHLDMGVGQTTFYTELKLLEHLKTFIEDILRDCKELPAHLGTVPVAFKEPIYGNEGVDHQQFMAPGMVFTMVFFLNTLVTGTIFMEERTEGLWDRSLIAGASTNHLLWSHLITQFVLSTMQNVTVIAFLGFVFNNIVWNGVIGLIVLLFLIAICGMFFGLLLSVYCKSFTEATYASTGLFYVMLLICGLLWPVEGMPKFIQYIVLFTPFSPTTLSARNMIVKGWDITHWGVLNGYVVISSWILIMYVLCVVGLKRKL